MALYRENPTCSKCGVEIKGKYLQPAIPIAGDTFYGWDWEGHVCRLGTKYFIERTDESKWWTGSNWTSVPIEAMLWESESEAKKYLTESTLIAPRIPCKVTEHEFVDGEKDATTCQCETPKPDKVWMWCNNCGKLLLSDQEGGEK